MFITMVVCEILVFQADLFNHVQCLYKKLSFANDKKEDFSSSSLAIKNLKSGEVLMYMWFVI